MAEHETPTGSAEKVVAQLRRELFVDLNDRRSLQVILDRIGKERGQAAALIESQREDRDSWRRVAERLEEEKRAAEARVTALEAEKAVLARLLKRYRAETPLGHQPHMIAAEVDQALSRSSTEVKNDG